MIFVFGSILQFIRVETDSEAAAGAVSFARHYKNSISGKGALQALAAAKAGGNVGLVGRTGDDELAKHILLRLRTHGVITSAVAKAEKMQTGTAIRLSHENKTILALGASAKASADQIPPEVLSPRNIVLVQTELPATENSKLLQTAKEQGATTILNLSPRLALSDDDLKNIDYLIAREEDKAALGDLAKYSHLTMIFLNSDGGCELRAKGAAAQTIPAPKSGALDQKNPRSREDAFCGVFAAGLYAEFPLDQTILRAQIAANITASKPVAYDATPYIDEINEHVKLINEAQ